MDSSLRLPPEGRPSDCPAQAPSWAIRPAVSAPISMGKWGRSSSLGTQRNMFQSSQKQGIALKISRGKQKGPPRSWRWGSLRRELWENGVIWLSCTRFPAQLPAFLGGARPLCSAPNHLSDPQTADPGEMEVGQMGKHSVGTSAFSSVPPPTGPRDSASDKVENHRKEFPTPLLHPKATGMDRTVWQALSMEFKGTPFDSHLLSPSPSPTPLPAFPSAAQRLLSTASNSGERSCLSSQGASQLRSSNMS